MARGREREGGDRGEFTKTMKRLKMEKSNTELVMIVICPRVFCKTPLYFEAAETSGHQSSTFTH